MLDPHAVVSETSEALREMLAVLHVAGAEPACCNPAAAEQWLRNHLADPQAPQASEVQQLVGELLACAAELEQQNRQLQEANRQLEDYRDRYVDLYDSAPLGYASLDEEGYLQEINLAGSAMLGAEREAITGYPFVNHVAPEDIEPFQAHLRQCIVERREATTEVRLKSDGQFRTVQLHSIPVIDAKHGGPMCKMAITDLTERKESEKALRESEARHRAILETSVDAIISIDERGIIDSVNPATERLFGYAREEMIGQNVNMLMPSPDRERHDSYIHHYQETGERKIIGIGREVMAQRKDGTTFPMDLSVSEIKLDGRRLFIGLVHDITDRKHAEDVLRRARDELEVRVRERTEELLSANSRLNYERYLFDTLMAYSPQSIYFKDAAHRYIRINQAMARSFHLTDVQDAIGKTDYDFFTAEYAQATTAEEAEIMRTAQPIFYKEEQETYADSRVRWVGKTTMPLYDETGLITGTFGLIRDITDSKQAAEVLRQAKDAAEAASQAKSTFLANMSHEIRTPMNAIIGMTELVLDTPLTAQQREFLTVADEAAESLLAIINDILDFSKIEAGRLALDYAPFDIREHLGDTLKSLAARADRRGIELVCRVHHEMPDVVIGDGNRLRQIVLNLVGNAIKFTEAGEVALEVDCERLANDEAVLHFKVRDTGIGVPPDKREAIFEAFEQGDGTISRRYGGTGLGLAISSRLVGLMGGQISLESEVGQGSVFSFDARVRVSQEMASMRTAHARVVLDGTQVLVVDDNQTNRTILEEMLTNWRLQPAAAAGGDTALDLLRDAVHGGHPYRLVVTDAHMPGVDGFALARQIRDDPELDSTVIMMLTSGDQPDDPARCEQLGVAAYLHKPVKQSELLDAITLVLGVTDADEESPVRPERLKRLRPLRILLAEDSLVNQKVTVTLLEREGHQVAVANNGKEAVAALAAGNFDLVLMDVQMPEMDGLEAAAIIRSRERRLGGHIPIVAMTAHALKGDRERCLEAGMDEYVSKPIRSRQLFATLAAVLGERGVPERTDEDVPAETAELIDWQLVRETARGDSDAVRTFVEAALEEMPRLCLAIDEAIEHHDPMALRLAAHTTKGSVRYFGAKRLYDLAMTLEQMGKEGDLSHARETFQELASEMERFTQALIDCNKGVTET